MFGREYSKHPEILLSSFREMNTKYKKLSKNKNSLFQKMYLSLFGIPEVGFQIRSLYFNDVIRAIKNKKIKKILDAGSGIGLYTFWLAKKYPDAIVTGGEIDQEKIKFAKEFAKANSIGNVDFITLDVTKPKSPNKYDLIVNIDVLEHIHDFARVLKNFYNLLERDGYLYIHTPQPGQRRIFKQTREWSHEDHVHEGYAPEDLEKELKKLGFRIINLRETFGLFGKLSWELNHMSFKKGLAVAGLSFPILHLISLLDLVTSNKNGLGTAILAKKID